MQVLENWLEFLLMQEILYFAQSVQRFIYDGFEQENKVIQDFDDKSPVQNVGKDVHIMYPLYILFGNVCFSKNQFNKTVFLFLYLLFAKMLLPIFYHLHRTQIQYVSSPFLCHFRP